MGHLAPVSPTPAPSWPPAPRRPQRAAQCPDSEAGHQGSGLRWALGPVCLGVGVAGGTGGRRICRTSLCLARGPGPMVGAAPTPKRTVAEWPSLLAEHIQATPTRSKPCLPALTPDRPPPLVSSCDGKAASEELRDLPRAPGHSQEGLRPPAASSHRHSRQVWARPLCGGAAEGQRRTKVLQHPQVVPGTHSDSRTRDNKKAPDPPSPGDVFIDRKQASLGGSQSEASSGRQEMGSAGLGLARMSGILVLTPFWSRRGFGVPCSC